MSEFPTLAEVVDGHIDDVVSSGTKVSADAGAWIAEKWREACTITTVEQLDALPVGCIVRSGGIAYYRHDGIDWFASNDEPYGMPSPHLDLPALLIHHPDWSKA